VILKIKIVLGFYTPFSSSFFLLRPNGINNTLINSESLDWPRSKRHRFRPHLNSMTQGKVFTASFVTKKGAFCISFSIVNSIQFLYQVKQLD